MQNEFRNSLTFLRVLLSLLFALLFSICNKSVNWRINKVENATEVKVAVRKRRLKVEKLHTRWIHKPATFQSSPLPLQFLCKTVAISVTLPSFNQQLVNPAKIKLISVHFIVSFRFYCIFYRACSQNVPSLIISFKFRISDYIYAHFSFQQRTFMTCPLCPFCPLPHCDRCWQNLSLAARANFYESRIAPQTVANYAKKKNSQICLLESRKTRAILFLFCFFFRPGSRKICQLKIYIIFS